MVLSLEFLELCNTVGDIRRVLRIQNAPPPSPFFPKCTYQTRENNMFSNLMTTYFGAEYWYHWIEISYNGISCFIPHKILCSFKKAWGYRLTKQYQTREHKFGFNPGIISANKAINPVWYCNEFKWKSTYLCSSFMTSKSVLSLELYSNNKDN